MIGVLEDQEECSGQILEAHGSLFTGAVTWKSSGFGDEDFLVELGSRSQGGHGGRWGDGCQRGLESLAFILEGVGCQEGSVRTARPQLVIRFRSLVHSANVC